MTAVKEVTPVERMLQDPQYAEIRDLDWFEDEKCEWVDKLTRVECKHEASWMAVCHTCGGTSLVCEKHHQWMLAKWRDRFGCKDCGSKGLLFEIVRFVRYGDHS